MEPERALAALGFTDLESRPYCELLRGSAATGYRLSQVVGKAPANVYQALASMAQKGIVFAEEGGSRAYRAAPVAQLIAELQRKFDDRRRLAEEALLSIEVAPEPDRVYQLRTTQQVFARARAMIEEARDILLFDLYPRPFELLRPLLVQACARGVTIAGVAYETLSGLGFPCVRTTGAALRDRMPGEQVTVCADGREFLTAHLSSDGTQVLHGLWSDSAYLACMQHSGLSCEIRLSALKLAGDPLAYLGLLRSAPEGLFALRREPAVAGA